MASGRPRNCTGDAPTSPVDLDPHGYNPGAFFCDGKPAPRGSRGLLPGERRLDLNLAYKPDFLKGWVARMDVFNVLNRQSTQAIDELYEEGSGGFRNTYDRVIAYTAPRSVRFSVAYEPSSERRNRPAACWPRRLDAPSRHATDLGQVRGGLRVAASGRQGEGAGPGWEQ